MWALENVNCSKQRDNPKLLIYLLLKGAKEDEFQSMWETIRTRYQFNDKTNKRLKRLAHKILPSWNMITKVGANTFVDNISNGPTRLRADRNVFQLLTDPLFLEANGILQQHPTSGLL
jgi:hypothetical protein